MCKFYNLPANQILHEINSELKQSFLALLDVLNFDFSKFEPFFQVSNLPNSKLRVSEIVKMAIFDIQILPKLISCKIECQIDS